MLYYAAFEYISALNSKIRKYRKLPKVKFAVANRKF